MRNSVVTKLHEMAAFWDIVGKAANLVQILGLDAVTVITIAMRFLVFHEVKQECQKLEERVRMLQVLLLSPAGCSIVQQQQHLAAELGYQVTNALNQAHNLIESYKQSTLFLSVLRARSTARQFRDLCSSIDSYCGLLLSISAYLLIHQANPPPPPLVR